MLCYMNRAQLSSSVTLCFTLGLLIKCNGVTMKRKSEIIAESIRPVLEIWFSVSLNVYINIDK